ncbi:DMT family transporter [Candidatus Woesebacteria bacterium]|nr:DMT family transporter [Candidatus Woesebacteria bacterium]
MIQVLAYIFYFIAASASPLQRRWLAKTKNIDNTGQTAFAFHVTLVAVVLSLGLLLYEPFHITGNIPLIITLTLVCGIFGSLTAVLGYTAQKHMEAGVTSVVSNMCTPITIVLATVFLSEKLTPIQIVGTIILFIGMIIVSKKHRVGKFTFDKYFLMMLSSGAFLGILITAERYLQKTTGFTTGTILSWWSVCLFLGLFTYFSKNKHSYSKKDIAITGVLRFLQNLSWVSLVYIVGNLSFVSAVTTFKVILMFIAGALFLNEREDLPRKIIGSLVAVGGLLLMK